MWNFKKTIKKTIKKCESCKKIIEGSEDWLCERCRSAKENVSWERQYANCYGKF